MAFTDFSTFSKFLEIFTHISTRTKNFIPASLANIDYPEALENEIAEALEVYRSNEQFICSFLITPILKTIWKKHRPKLNLWTGEFIKADERLAGRPDFLISALSEREQYQFLTPPLFVAIEAKKGEIDEAWGQCAAEMLACQKINNKSEITIFGAVTTGKVWEFGKLYQNMLTIHTIPYSVGELQKLLNILNYFFEEVEKQLPLVDITIILNTDE